MTTPRHPKSGKPILNHDTVVCVDDFGNEVVICQYTRNPVSVADAIYIGPCIPQLNGTYLCAADAMPAFKASKRNFDEMDANCNSCQHLERVQFVRNSSTALMPGVCGRTKEKLLFHPDDHMGMVCWEGRP